MALGRDMLAAQRKRVILTRRAFTLIELVITLGIVALLIGLLTPALGAARETAQRLGCASNEYGLGSGLSLYARDHRDSLPPSYFGAVNVGRPQEMMSATTGPIETVSDRWEGLGFLSTQAGGYVDCDKCFFCPSHHGNHHADKHTKSFSLGGSRMFVNYHYSGDIEPGTNRRRRIDLPATTILLADGLRTRSDFNHGVGTNRLHGDLSVSWWLDRTEFIGSTLPEAPIPPSQQVALYLQIWKSLVEQ